MHSSDFDEVSALPESAAEREERTKRTRQNDLAPISHLPAEIMANIFVHCIPTSIASLDDDFSWLNVTRICHQWRSVALACPEFWSTLILSRPKWTQVMLARSKKAPLVIRADLLRDTDNTPEPILLENAVRLGALEILGPGDLLANFMTNLKNADAAPHLNDIKITNSNSYPENLDNPACTVWLPRDLFRRKEVSESRRAGRQSGIRLHLDCCAFPWGDSLWYSHLTELHLSNLNMEQRPEMDAFLNVLSKSPNLQALTLYHACPVVGNGFDLEMPHLNLLNITDDPSYLCWLMDCLIVPSSTIINTSAIVYGGGKGEFPKSICEELIPMFSEDLGPEQYDTASIDCRNTFTYSLRHSANTQWSRTLRIQSHYTCWQPHWPNTLKVTQAIRSCLNLSNITTLHLDSLPAMPSMCDADGSVAMFISSVSLWDTLGRNLARLETLHLYKSFPGGLFDLILAQAMLLINVSHHRSCFHLSSGGLPLRGPDGSLTHAWPKLQRLELHEIDLARLDNLRKPCCGDLLRAYLWARREGAPEQPGTLPIWQLKLHSCSNVSMSNSPPLERYADVWSDVKAAEWPTVTADLRAHSVTAFVQMVSANYRRAVKN
ncbi:hypothetical protein R3P38DRAFT_2953156 [Favolaschia claudopus]|uniref:F-box domain-containing protein n=1 Tax=Favolaschia claudopus TaxID=2862362 RepID=A0AAW0BI34_9AGAR